VREEFAAHKLVKHKQQGEELAESLAKVFKK